MYAKVGIICINFFGANAKKLTTNKEIIFENIVSRWGHQHVGEMYENKRMLFSMEWALP